MRVKVLCLGRAAKEIEVGDGMTVEQAIQQAGFPKDASYTRQFNGSPAFDTDVLHDGNMLRTNTLSAPAESENPFATPVKLASKWNVRMRA